MNNQIFWIVLKRLRIPFLVIIVTFTISIIGMVLIPGVTSNGKPYHFSFFDAFYFVSYMATTIGFGEEPYAFTYPQRIWVSFSIYLTVIGWFYGIGTIISLIQDNALRKAISKNRFTKQIQYLSQKFIIILGYNNITKSIIEHINSQDLRTVVLDKDEIKIDQLVLNNFFPNVPAFVGQATDQQILKMAGINHKNCIGIVSLFENDIQNLKIATICRMLNKKIDIIVKSTSRQHTQLLLDMGLKHIQNPFDIISKRLYYGIIAPHIWLLEMWVYGNTLQLRHKDSFPKGKYIIFGKGRMGQAIIDGLNLADIQYTLYDATSQEYAQNKQSMVFGDTDDIKTLTDLGVTSAACIIAATRDDLFNLTVLKQAKILNPNIFTIARENSLEDTSIFQVSRIDKVFINEKILADITYNFLSRPLATYFIQEIRKQNEVWAEKLVANMKEMIGATAGYFELQVNLDETYALWLRLDNREAITLKDILRLRENRNSYSPVICLLALRDGATHLLPNLNFNIQKDDKLLFAANAEAFEDLLYIINNIYELDYILNKNTLHPNWLFSKVFQSSKDKTAS